MTPPGEGVAADDPGVHVLYNICIVPLLDTEQRTGQGASSRVRIAPDGSIESVQRATLTEPVVAHDAYGAAALATVYWTAVRASTRGLVRVRAHAHGFDLVLLGVVPLLRFGSAETLVTDERVASTFPIVGGLLTFGAGGSLTVEQCVVPTPALSIAVRGYRPRLARRSGRLYARLQLPAHDAVSRRFLRWPLEGGGR